MVGGVPVFGSRRRGLVSRVVRRGVALLIVGAGVGAVFLLSHLTRVPSAHEADDQEEACRTIEESGEEEVGELANCLKKLSHLRAVEHDREASSARALDSVRRSP